MWSCWPARDWTSQISYDVSNHTVRHDYVLYRLIITTAITIINNIITWYKIRTKDEFGEKVSDRIRE